MATHLVWFRQDLRVADNLALHHACQDKKAHVIAVFIATPEQWRQHNMSPRQAGFILQHIQQLQIELNHLNIQLLYSEVSDFKAQITSILTLCQQYGITELFYNRQYEWNERQRDNELVYQLDMIAIRSRSFDDSVLLPPGSVVNGQGEMYKVYTPFRNRCLALLHQKIIRVLPRPEKRIQSVKTEIIPITPFTYPCQQTPSFPVGEIAAISQLRLFCREQVTNYLRQRDIPSLDGTSRLSPYLAIGVISPRQCFARLTMEYPELEQQQQSGEFTWFNELIWREFYRHLLVAYPRLSKNGAFIPWTENIHWNYEHKTLLCWQKGLTGYPIVDAAMRQLNQTGWMHNRLRMIVASFLVKDLLIDWRLGEQYFMTQLVDGDLAANNGGWQWAASTGVDSTPYFRIFNPTTQGQRFDSEGTFIRQYISELSTVPDKFIHEPHLWAKKNNILLNYPQPIIDHKVARISTLSAFDLAKKG